jgi:outer membrane biosynthesis protein TonB
VNTSAASAKPNEAKSVDAGAPAAKFNLPARSPDPVDAVLDPSAVAVAGATKHSKKHVAPNMYSGKATAPNGSVAPAATETTATVSAAPESYIAPKLLRGSKSVAPPEAIRNYVAGDVTMDALVDTAGHVQSVKVVSGPAKLYGTATEVMKQYVYEPARKNGKPVPAHVQVSLQFWYAP